MDAFFNGQTRVNLRRFRVQHVFYGFRAHVSEFGAQGSGFGAQGSGFRAQDSGFGARVQGLELRVQGLGSGFRV